MYISNNIIINFLFFLPQQSLKVISLCNRLARSSKSHSTDLLGSRSTIPEEVGLLSLGRGCINTHQFSPSLSKMFMLELKFELEQKEFYQNSPTPPLRPTRVHLSPVLELEHFIGNKYKHFNFNYMMQLEIILGFQLKNAIRILKNCWRYHIRMIFISFRL